MNIKFKESLQNYLPNEEINGLIEAIEKNNTTHALILNTKKMEDCEFTRRFPNVKPHPFVKHAYLYDKNEYDFGKCMLYEDGVYSIEDPSAMMVPYFLNPGEGDIVLDMCAAPGGKTITSSLLMDGTGTIIGNDISYPRAKNMSQNIERMGSGNVIVASNDFIFSHEHFTNTFDKIILDAPCSGSAMMRKNPKARDQWSINKVHNNSRRQKELLNLAYSMLKEGGTIAYSTCSFSKEEDEDVILWFKEEHPEIEIVNLESSNTFYRSKNLPEAVYLFPHKFEGEGQFVCLFKKPGELIKTPKKIVQNHRYERFLGEYNLNDRSNEIHRKKFYSISQYFDISHLNILRYGVKLFEMRNTYIPDHHLTHFLDASYSWRITKDEANIYVHGGSFPTNRPDGFYIVSYDNQNLGYVKVTQGVAKNHYPKGLRYPDGVVVKWGDE